MKNNNRRRNRIHLSSAEKQRRAIRRRRESKLRFETLEDRRLLAMFVEAGPILNLELEADESVGIVANANTYELTITGGTGNWTGSNSVNVTGNGGNTLTVTTAGQTAFDRINITDAGTDANTSVLFNGGIGNYTDAFSVALNNAGAGNITFAANSNFDTADGILTAQTTAAITVNAGVGVTQTNGTLSLSAGTSITAPGIDNGIADIAAPTISLVAGGAAAIGSSAANRVEVDAGTLNATTAGNHIWLTDTFGGVALGNLDAGSAMIVLDVNGSITDGNGAAVNLTAGNGVNLTTTGPGSAIGTVGDPIETAIGALSATTNDGGIFVADSNALGLIVNTVVAKQGGKTPFIGGGNQVVVDLPAVSGTHDVSITAQGSVMLNSVVAPDAVTLNSATGVILDMNQEANDILAQSVTLIADGAVGQITDPIEMTVERFSANTTDGDIFLSQGIVGTAISVVAGGANNDVVVKSAAETLRIKVIAAQGNVTVRNAVGSLLDDNGGAVNISGQVVDLSGATGIGTTGDPLETTAVDLVATVTDSAAPIFIAETNGLNSVAAKTNAGDVTITFTGGPLQYTASTEVLAASGAGVTFETTSGNVKLDVVDAGAGDVIVTAPGAITDDTSDSLLDLRGGTVTLLAGTGIGALGNEIDTEVATLIATTTSGGVFIRETNALSLTASTLGGDIDVRTATGDMTLGQVSATGLVTLHAGGAILDGNANTNNVSADTLDLVALSGIGTGGDGLETSVNDLTASGGAGGGLFLSNNKTLTLTSASATGGNVSVAAAGNLTLAGALNATGQDVVLSAIGELIDMNVVGDDITANNATLNAAKIGVSGDKIETRLASLTAATTSGGIFVSNTGTNLALVATALGQSADIDINTTGDIVLDTATAQGDTVKLRAGGGITDGNDPPPPTQVNITAKTLDIAAPGGIGTTFNPLEVDVDQVATVDGGTNGASVTNAGPLLLTETALQSAGVGTLAFDAESITIENIGDDMATLAANRSLELRTQTGDIVFLDSADTIEASGVGTITIQAGMIAGSGGVAVLGNLKTAGGDILVTADKHITIGQLDAGSGDVTVQSLSGIILDGNGATINVIAGTTTLVGAAPTAREAELHEEFKIAEAAAANAEAAAKETSAEAFGSGSEIVAAATVQAQAAVNSAVTMVATRQAIYDPLNQTASDLEIAIEVSSGIAFGLDIAATAAETAASVAQVIPLTGDGGAATVASVIIIASKVADAAVLAETIAKDKIDTKKGNAETALTEAKAELAAARSTLTLATQTRNAFQESFSIADASAIKAGIVRDASARVRDQAVLARDQANVIGTFADPLGLQITGVINVTAGPTDSYLQVVGDTAVDLIQATGSVTLISTGVISDADAGGGADITGLGLTTIAVGGIGTAADPLETRVDTLNASNTTGGDIAIANTVGTPAALDITGITNVGGGDVIISNQGSTAAGQGITISGPVSAAGGGAGVTINSGSPLTVAADVSAAGPVTLTAAETAGAGDDLTVNAGVTIESTGASVLLRAGDNINVASTATIKAITDITITANFNDDAADATGAEVVVAGSLIATSALINVDPAADDDDTFIITPSVSTPITVDAEDGIDTLNFVADGLPVTILGNTITAAGRAAVTFNNFEFVNILNSGGDGSVTLLTAPGDADVMVLTGTGQGAGTFTLNGGIPISFSGTTSFTFNAGDMDDAITVSPFATSVLPWNVAVAIDGGAGTDRITYNNVVGLFDHTIVTATAPGAGHIDSPGVTSALNSQLVTFTNVEDITANANPGEDESLTVNHRDTSAVDITSLLFDPTPGADDLQLAGLFDMVIDTDNYVGLTINGRGGDDTFNVTPGPIPVRIDGGDPVGATAGDLINFTPSSVFIIEPGPENDEGGFNAVGSQRVSWDHIEEISVTGGGPSVFLGTNGDDDITIIARDSSTHAAADGVQDFTVSLNNGPSILYLDSPVFFVDSLGGDDDVVVREAAPNGAAWNVQLFVAQGTPGMPTGDQGDVFALETPGTQTVDFTPNPASFTIPSLPAGVTLSIPSPSGVDTAIVNDATNTSVISLTPFNLSVPLANFVFTSSPGGVDTILYNGLGGGDALTMHGSAFDDTFIINPSNGGSGSFRSDLSPTFDFTGADAITATGGSGGSDEVIVEGTNSNDVITASAATRMVTVTDSTGTTLNPVVLGAGIDIATIEAKKGDDLILASPDPVGGATVQFNIHGDLPNASDRLVVEDQGIGNTVQHHQGTDGRSGSVIVGAWPPVSYEGIEYIDILPLDDDSSSPTFGGTGSDGLGRIVVFHPDPFSQNNSFRNPTELPDLAQHTAKPNISPGGQTDPFGPGFDLPGDVDWYRFIAPKTGTFRFDVLFDTVGTLANGQPGLPGDGLLRVDMFESDGTAIVRLPTETDANMQTIGVEEGLSYLLRVQGQTVDSINLYDINVVDLDLLGPQVFDPDGPGPLHAVQITDNPTYNLFDVKPVSQGPTPLVHSITVNIQDLPVRFPGFIYGALDTDVSSAVGHYQVVGDHNGIVAISKVIVRNAPVMQGELATATIEIQFEQPLPDDRFTLTISDSVVDPGGNKLDGEGNAQEPQGKPAFPSGDTVAGGDFVARFTVDSRAEIGVAALGSVYVDTNGNNLFDPEAVNSDDTNEDIVYKLGFQTDNTFAGNFAAPGSVADGFDKLGSYGQVAGQYRWLIDTNNNGVPDLVVADPAQVNGRPVAGNFDGNVANGDDVGLKAGTIWYLDTNHDFQVDTTLNGDMVGLPIVGDFDGDGIDDLGAWADDVFSLDLSADGIDGFTDQQFTFGFPGVREIPVAADFNGDGLDDIGLWNPDVAGVTPSEQADWMILLSQPASNVQLDTGVFNGVDSISSANPQGTFLADDFVPVDPSQEYHLSGQARSGDGVGGQFEANNRQYFGFASYDSDQLQIVPFHVNRFANAADTQLAAPLNPGDTQIVLQDASGWANAGAAHHRSLAWYGYTNSDGFTYPDYTYTRNVASNLTTGLWSAGGIAGNVITLNQPWAGPAIPAGMAVRNTMSGGTYNYAALSYQSVPEQWTEYGATLSGSGMGLTQFRPGTAFIKPVMLTNFVAGSTNLINWRNVEVSVSTAAVPVTDRIVPNPQGAGNVIDFTPDPFGPDLYASYGDVFALPVVGNFDPPVVPASGSAESVVVVGLNATNAVNAFDVDGSGNVEPRDALAVINYLNRHGSGAYGEGVQVEASGIQQSFGAMPDVNGDGRVEPLDALSVINQLNRLSRDSVLQGELAAGLPEMETADGREDSLQVGDELAVLDASTRKLTQSDTEEVFSQWPADLAFDSDSDDDEEDDLEQLVDLIALGL